SPVDGKLAAEVAGLVAQVRCATFEQRRENTRRAGERVSAEERQAVLGYHNAARLQRPLAVREKLLGVQHRRRADWLRAVDDDRIELLGRLRHILQAITNHDVGPRVVEGAIRDLRIVLQREIDDAAVDLAERRLLDGRMLQDLTKHAAVAAANDEHPSRSLEGHQRHVGHHLMVDELVERGELKDAVENEHRAPDSILENDKVLMLSFLLMEDLVRLHANTPVGMKRLLDPALHRPASIVVQASPCLNPSNPNSE